MHRRTFIRRQAGRALRASAVLLLAGCAAGPSSAPAGGQAASQEAAASAPSPAASGAADGMSPEERALQQRFAQWLAGFRASAVAAGVGEPTLRTALDGARYLPRVVELDRAQPEFTRAVWDYLDIAVSAQRVAQGQEKLKEVQAVGQAAAERYGVPLPTLVAIWGIESNYGGNYGSTPTIDALATLAFDARREAWARSQLITALKIVQSGDIDREHMIGSWAGAMGQTQFMPSAFVVHAVDGDGDGRRDIWGSMADVLASTANFLAHSGWQAGQVWGVEVQLPPGFDHARADPAVRQTSEQWSAEGLRTMDGSPLPAFADGSVLLPAGARGPAFLVGPNFRVIMRYNNSNSYALAVSLLSQRIADGLAVQAPWPRDLVALTRSQVMALQTALNDRGFASGTADGAVGPATRQAVRAYQRSVGLAADGFPTLDLLQRLVPPPETGPETAR
ncbi:lytic murein transglycosylase [Ideonella sp. DXS29W]|uniref:Lytic murein transglycosylase n=1 Tax=Ideonella lacteola TaxID=2984193 RepID=A0ABU9BR10_9BURK